MSVGAPNQTHSNLDPNLKNNNAIETNQTAIYNKRGDDTIRNGSDKITNNGNGRNGNTTTKTVSNPYAKPEIIILDDEDDEPIPSSSTSNNNDIPLPPPIYPPIQHQQPQPPTQVEKKPLTTTIHPTMIAIRNRWRRDITQTIRRAFRGLKYQGDTNLSELVEIGCGLYVGIKDYFLHPEKYTYFNEDIEIFGEDKLDELWCNVQYLSLVDELLTEELLRFGSLALQMKVRTVGKGRVKMKDIIQYSEEEAATIAFEKLFQSRIESYLAHFENLMKELSYGICESDNVDWQVNSPIDKFLNDVDSRILLTYNFLTKKGESRISFCRLLIKEYWKWDRDPDTYVYITPAVFGAFLKADPNISKVPRGTLTSGIHKLQLKPELKEDPINSVKNSRKRQRGKKKDKNSGNSTVNTDGYRVGKRSKRSRGKKKKSKEGRENQRIDSTCQ
ncbi:uncharacterized protein J8A68_003271 [[Candida] subhashii]|uniref:Uncharacterized protein n=1 Tax=[Candida] subhashii TaxID=561895 RepID=A0A8J5QJJ9_9ASCO|nr:uncharacterized protein J8A68_003271 [[Candida] subhashii]KAG7663189.1 hypothetical protein J8A68_003271 [[Candida] subhashii]